MQMRRKHRSKFKRHSQNKGPIYVKDIEPDIKDLDRAHGLTKAGKKSYNGNAPFTSSARKMANLIKDRRKMVRRAMAVISIWGTHDHVGTWNGVEATENAWIPFKKAMATMNFSEREIDLVSRFSSHNIDPMVRVGLEELM